MAFTLRPAILSDVPDATCVIDAAYAGYAKRGLELPPVSEGVAVDITDNTVFVAEDANDIVGVMILILSPHTAKLANVAVHPKHGGRGIGGALMRRAVQIAMATGHQALHLTTHIDMPENIALYRNLGWTQTRTEGNKVHMTLAMQPDTDGDIT